MEYPKMTTECKELFSIFMKIGGEFYCDYEKNTCTLYKQNITCNNLDKIENNITNFIYTHRYYPLYDNIIKINEQKNYY